jgi:formylglycine-generating enzyme required for sulfatase activity
LHSWLSVTMQNITVCQWRKTHDTNKDPGLLDVFRERAAAPEWRNTLSLLFGRVLGTRVSPERGINLMRDMIGAISSEAISLQLVAADCIETLLAKGVRLSKDQESQLREIFLQAMHSDAPAGDRASLGNALARLGDPRFHADAWYLPDEPLLGFVEIPEGPFLMGSKKGDPLARKDELDQHSVTLLRYYIARYPVTVAQFQAFVQDSRYQPQDEDSLRGLSNHPVVYVSWYEAHKYCEWLTERLREWKGTPEPLATLLRHEGWQVTLPSEAEWEKAARGTEGRIYPWGNDPDPNRANYRDTGINDTTAVGCFPGGVTPYGCLDMAGNVWEWTRSLGIEYPYPTEAKERAQGEDLSARGSRVLRGGAFNSYAHYVRCAYRDYLDPDYRFNFLGFRVVVSPFFSER